MKRLFLIALFFCCYFSSFAQYQTAFTVSQDETKKELSIQLKKAKTMQTSGFILTMAGLISTGTGLIMNMEDSPDVLIKKSATQLVNSELESKHRSPGTSYIVGGLAILVAGIPTLITGVIRTQNIRMRLGPKKQELFFSIVPAVSPDSGKLKAGMGLSLRF